MRCDVIGVPCVASLLVAWHRLGGQVPSSAGAKAQEIDSKFVADVQELTTQYLKQLDGVQIREALKTVMKIAAAGNKYTQDTKPWLLVKSAAAGDKERCALVVSHTLHCIRWLAILVDPYMPTVSELICKQLNVKLSGALLAPGPNGAVAFDTNALKPGHAIGEPVPIFREIKAEEVCCVCVSRVLCVVSYIICVACRGVVRFSATL
jgi:methionyl-tRNA synthetase